MMLRAVATGSLQDMLQKFLVKKKPNSKNQPSPATAAKKKKKRLLNSRVN
jgi:hypothetical protein